MIVERVAKKDDNTVVIYLDNNEKLFLSYEVLLKNGLKKGSEISEDRFSLLVVQNRKYHIRQKAITFLAKRIHSKRELENKLRKKNYEIELIKAVLDKLEEKGLIDDNAFANQFTEEKLNRKKWGLQKIKSELLKKGVSPDIVNKVLKSFADSESQLESAIDVAKKKLNLISKKESDKKKIKQKLSAFLLSRGFDYEISRDAVNKLIIKEEDYYE